MALISNPGSSSSVVFSAPAALATKAENIVTGHFEGATLTRSKIKILVGATIVLEAVISVANTGVTAIPFCFTVPAASKWQWEKVEGTVESFKFSTTTL